MKRVLKAIGFGVLIWTVVAAVMATILPLMETNRALYDWISAVAISLSLVGFSALYLKNVSSNVLKESTYFSLIVVVVCATCDASMIMLGVLKLSDVSWMLISYLMTPIIITGMGYMGNQRRK
jgi:hypothetical protein